MLFIITGAFLIAMLSGMGVGSGGLLVVFLTLFANVPQLTAQGLNLIFFLFSSGASLLWHVQKRELSLFTIALTATAGLLGAIPGSFAALILPESLVRQFFGIMLVLSGTASLLKGNKNAEKNVKKRKIV